MKLWRTLAGLALLVAIAAAAPRERPADLHFALRASLPEADSSVPAPEEVRLAFTEEPQDNSMAVNLIDASGKAVETGEPTYDSEDRRVIHVDVATRLPAGRYTVSWRGMGDDGHVVRGDFAFSVTAQ